jgi:hypothetical protein
VIGYVRTNQVAVVHAKWIWCQWNGAHIHMHLTVFSQKRGTSITVLTHYKIGGQDHGDSLAAGFKDVTLSRGWSNLLLDAGQPEGVSGQPPISQCSPDIYSGPAR